MRKSLEERQLYVNEIMKLNKPLLNMVTPHIENKTLSCLCIIASEFMLQDFIANPGYKPDISVRVKPGLEGKDVSIRLDFYFPTGHPIFDGWIPIDVFQNKITQIPLYVIDTKMQLVYNARISMKL